jgi:predicted transcriptional regulator
MILDNRNITVHNYSMKPVKAMTIRLSSEQADALETVAAVEAMPVSEVIRAAIAEHIDSKKKDPQFQDSLRDRLERAKRLLKK